MPLDYKRFNGPENSFSYQTLIDNLLPYYQRCESLIDRNGCRKDGRTLEQARPIFAKTDLVSQAKGSAYVELKNTKVVCSVFDPREIPQQNEFSDFGEIFCEVKFAPFSCPRRRRPHAPDAEEKALSNELRQALEPAVCRHLFPNYQIDVYVYILEHDGSCLAAAINAAGLALANAAVPMYDTITACSAAVIGDHIFMDPTEYEEGLALESNPGSENHGVVTMSMLIHISQVTDFCQIGAIDAECVQRAIDVLADECKKILPDVQKIIIDNVFKNIEEHNRQNEEEKVINELLDEQLEQWKKLLISSECKT